MPSASPLKMSMSAMPTSIALERFDNESTLRAITNGIDELATCLEAECRCAPLRIPVELVTSAIREVRRRHDVAHTRGRSDIRSLGHSVLPRNRSEARRWFIAT